MVQPGKGVIKAIQEAAGDDITLETQPANSRGLNVSDLDLFHSIQELKEDVGVTNGEELKEVVEATIQAFDVYPQETLEQVSQSLLQSMERTWGARMITDTRYLTSARRSLLGQAIL
ncbi:unnamed protein product [Discosporangium mesarthrocarpum]